MIRVTQTRESQRLEPIVVWTMSTRCPSGRAYAPFAYNVVNPQTGLIGVSEWARSKYRDDVLTFDRAWSFGGNVHPELPNGFVKFSCATVLLRDTLAIPLALYCSETCQYEAN